MGFTKGHTINVGKPCSEETKRKLSVANAGKKIHKMCICGSSFEVIPSKRNRAKFCSKECFNKSKKGKPAWNKGLLGYMAGEKHHWFNRDVSGEKSPSWKGGKEFWKKDNNRNDPAYQVWRMKVWMRDGFKCKIGNNDCNGRIEAHHILGWKEYVELRYEVNNGITLCHAHHPRKRAEEKRLVPTFKELMSVSSDSI